MKSKVFTIGEMLIDMVSLDGILFEKKAGGAPANVSSGISKLGGDSYFLGCVGDDSFGCFLIDTLKKNNVNTSMVIKNGVTTLAFVSIDKYGERDFSFLRGSDRDYSFDNIDLSLIGSGDIIHFGSATFYLGGTLRETYFKMLSYVKENNIFISFDANYRGALISEDKLHDFIKDSKEFIYNSNFIKLSKEELEIITRISDVHEGIKFLRDLTSSIICITLGSDGCILSLDSEIIKVPSIRVNQVDSTGCGDAFVSGVLYKLIGVEDKYNIHRDTWIDIVRFGNKVGALTSLKYGAIDAIPNICEID